MNIVQASDSFSIVQDPELVHNTMTVDLPKELHFDRLI
jgi:hypothetical protein